jgi:hypothetical protein
VGIENYCTRIQAGGKGANFGRDIFKLTGFWAMANREMMFTSVMWTCNENLREIVRDRHLGISNFNINLLSAVVSASLSALVSFPFDLSKTLRISYPEKFRGVGTGEMFKIVYRENGVSGLTAGLGPRMARYFCGALVFFGCYEWQMMYLLGEK